MIAPHHPDEIGRLADICHMVFNTDVFVDCRERAFVDARVVFASLLHEQGLGPTRIGLILGRNHSTVLHYFRKAEALLQTDPVFRQRYVQCREQYIGEDPVFYYTSPELRKKFMELRQELEETRDKLQEARKQLKYDQRLKPILDVIRIRTKRGEEDEALIRINRLYNGL
jgi:hypothetical protein